MEGLTGDDQFPHQEQAQVTFRYDGFLDEEGARLGSGVRETRNSFTFCPIYEVGNGFKAQLEIRHTVSDKNVFVDRSGATYKQLTEMTLGFTYSF